jgi:hypothetical protein
MIRAADNGTAHVTGHLLAGHRLTRALVVAGAAAFALADAILLTNAVRVLQASAAAIAYPFELDFAEGLVLAPTHALFGGQAIYPPPGAWPVQISNYTPVFYALAGTLGTMVGNHLAAGRAVSLAAAVVAAAVLAALVWRALTAAAARPVRALAAACAGLGFMQISYTASWAALMRVDLLAVCLAFVGVLVFGAGAARGRRVYWCVLPFVLAAYTKQTTIAAAAACVLTAARANPRRGLALGGALAAALALTAAALQLGTGGGFAFHVVTGNVHAFHWNQAAAFLQDLAIRYPVLIALAAAVVPALLASLPSGREAERSPERTRGWTRAALGAYLPLAALTSLSVGKLGAEVNYLIELMGVVGAAAALAIGDALAVADRPSRALAALALPALLLWQVAYVAPPRAIETIEVPAAAEQAQVAQIVDLVRRANGPVLSEDLTLLTLADKPIRFQPFDITQLIYRHEREQADVVGALQRGEFRLVVLHFDVRNPSPVALDRFPPAVIETIRTHYQLLSRSAGYWLYAPQVQS